MINFTKATASGNDFVMIDNRNYIISENYSEFVKIACNRKFGVGADGVIFIEEDQQTDFWMRYFNADGSEGSLCGNGARCAAKFMSEIINKKELVFKAVGKIYRAEIFDKTVKLYLPDLSNKIDKLKFDLVEAVISAGFLDTGSPHVVIYESDFPSGKDLQSLDVYKLGKEIRYHKVISPNGANINFVKMISNSQIKIRTYERGVEDETLACGTGSIASAISSVIEKNCSSPISVFTQGGEEFKVNFEVNGETITKLSLEGSALMVFDGICNYTESNKLVHK